MTILAAGSLSTQLAPSFWGYAQHQPGTHPWLAVFKFLKTLHHLKQQSCHNPLTPTPVTLGARKGNYDQANTKSISRLQVWLEMCSQF